MPPGLHRTTILDDRTLRGRDFCVAYTDMIERWLVELFVESGGEAADVALVALGGQGRREVAPQSDLDLLLLVGSNGGDELAEKLWYPIWDAGLKLGHSVRNTRDTLSLAADDLETATSLLSARHICGDERLTADLAERARTNWRKRGKRWLDRLTVVVDQRHDEYGHVAFDLEPDLKEAAGGLRDVHCLDWARAAGAELDVDMGALREHLDVLLSVRVELHRAQAKPGDRLLFQEQDVVAARLDMSDADELMAQVATAGRAISLYSDEAWHDIRSASSGGVFGRMRRDRQVDAELVVRDGRVAFIDAGPVIDPFAVLRVANLAARERVRIARSALDVLQAAPGPGEVWTDAGRELFCELLLTGPSAVSVIEILDQADLWTRLIPEWEPTRSRPQRNAYHRFTVDRHLLEAAAEAAGLAQGAPRPDLLVMGALLHDIGKGYPELGDHSIEGAVMAAAIARRMGFDDEDVSTIEALVRHHLLLPDVATRRDLDDPATIEFVASQVRTADRVALLRALTVADSLATGPAAWSEWKSDLVDRLARLTAAVLGGEQIDDVISDSFPTVAQRELLLGGDVRVSAEGDTITVACPDRPGVFFRVAGALALHGLNVREANIYSEDEMALDEFRVATPASGVVPWDRVQADVVKVLEGRLALQARMEERARSHQRRRRPGAHQLATKVRFDNGASAGSTVVEVSGPDSVGLLYRLARSLAEFNLNVTGARIHTVGADVVDSFYVTDGLGDRITDMDLQSEITRALLNALDVPA